MNKENTLYIIKKLKGEVKELEAGKIRITKLLKEKKEDLDSVINGLINIMTMEENKK